MAQYNTFIVQETKGGRPLLVTSSARKAKQMLTTGVRVEVWSGNQRVETIHTRTMAHFNPYTAAEREYIRSKQAAAEQRNRLRRITRASIT